jgi:hypothetical protein
MQNLDARNIRVGPGRDAPGAPVRALSLEDVVREFESRGCEAAVVMAGGGPGLGRLGKRITEIQDGVGILQWLTRLSRSPDGPRPILVVRTGSGLVAVRHEGVDGEGYIHTDGPAGVADGVVSHDGTFSQEELAARLFAVVYPLADAPADHGQEKPTAPEAEMPWNIYDAAIPAYGVPPGLPLEVVWRSHFDLGHFAQMCLIDTDNQPDASRIPYRELLDGPAFVATCRAILERGTPFSLGVRTGRAGHFVTARAWREGSIFYQDPWGGRSMLCWENNDLGVSARSWGDLPGSLWSITEDELQRVSCAAVVAPEPWAELRGIDPPATLDGIIGSDFGSSFHLQELARSELSEDARVSRFSIGGNADLVLSCTTDASDRVHWARLVAARSHLERAGSHRSMYLDLLTQFLSAFLQPPDRLETQYLCDALLAAGRNDAEGYASLISQGPVHLRDVFARFADAILSPRDPESLAIPLLLSNLHVNGAAGTAASVTIDLVLGVARRNYARWDPSPRSRL